LSNRADSAPNFDALSATIALASDHSVLRLKMAAAMRHSDFSIKKIILRNMHVSDVRLK
jgi:hypothetical protein